MIEPEYFNYNETEYGNFTTPLNATGNDVENGNASRHFADQPNTDNATINFTHGIVIFFSAVVLCIVLLYIVLFIHDYCSQSRRILSLRDEVNRDGVSTWPCRPDLLSVIPNEGADQTTFQNGDEVHILDTPSSLYVGDIFPSYSDSSGREKLFSDTITTPLSNNSVITMTMKNDHLIVETEERVPVSISNCSFLNADEMYTNYLAAANGLSSIGTDEYDYRDFDDTDSYFDDHHNHHVCTVENEDRRTFYEPTTSRQADEEDQHVELFHKNIIVFPTTPATPTQATADRRSISENVPTCSYVNGYSVAANNVTSSTFDPPATANTGLAQSDHTGSASSNTSRHVRNEYSYGNQTEYFSPELPLSKHRSALRLSIYNKKASSSSDPVEYSSSSPFSRQKLSSPLQPPLPHDHSVLQLNDCSSSKFSESNE